MSLNMVTLVDKEDHFTGVMDKMAAHRKGELHRAFSVFLFNQGGELLLQQRASTKYHSGGLWTNSCCSHPQPGEEVEEAAYRRLKEELSIKTLLFPLFSFQYEATFANGLIENELDHILIGITDDLPHPDPEEIEDWRYVRPEELQREVLMRPTEFTVWFQILFSQYGERIIEAFRQINNK